MKNLLSNLDPKIDPEKRLLLVVSGVVALVVIFVFQQFNYSELLFGLIGVDLNNRWSFVLNKIIRFLLNDLAVISVIFGIFYQKKYVDLALWVMGFGFLFILLPYLWLAINYPEYNGAMYSHLHRLVMNPVLLILLIPFLLYQKLYQKIH